MKKLLSLLPAAALLASSMPVQSVSAETDSSIEFIYEISDGSAVITGYTGSDAVLIIPDTIEDCPVEAIAGSVFMGLDELTAAVIPDSVKTIGERSFSACPNLCTVSIGSGMETVGEYVFSACPMLTSISVSDENPTFLSVEGCLCNAEGRRLLTYAGPNDAVIPAGVTSISKAAFLGKTDLTSAAVPYGVTFIGDYAFSGCTGLRYIALPDTVSQIGAGCFMSCSELETVKLGLPVKAIKDNTFNACSSLKYITITERVSSIGSHAFFGCSELSGLYIPETVTSISETAIGQHYSIRNGAVENIAGFVVHGEEGTAVESYAESEGITFRKFICGDINDDGAIDGSDATMALREYASVGSGYGTTLNAYGQLAADYDLTGGIDGSDATLILKEYARRSAYVPEIPDDAAL